MLHMSIWAVSHINVTLASGQADRYEVWDMYRQLGSEIIGVLHPHLQLAER